ncbi:MAG: hypothetical protein AAFZ49_06255, partial [Cyanobacteria bacterium J06659_2]
MTTLRPDSNTVAHISASPLPESEGSQSPMKLPQQKQTFRQKLGIRAVVVVSFVVPIVTAVSLTGWFSIRNGQQAVNNLVNQLSSELTNRIE